MKFHLLGISLISLMISCSDQDSRESVADSMAASGKTYQSEDSVRAAFDNYKAAILNDKGEEAMKYVDSRTIAYYDNLIELVRTADSTELESLSMLDKFMVLVVRYRTTKEDILAFDGNDLLVYAINSGMVGKSSVANNSIGEVTIVDEFASGNFINNGNVSPFDFHFYYENGGWRVDLTSIFVVSETAFKQVIAQSGMPENEFLISTLQATGEKKSDGNIWEPVKK
jgi:hypothetical protein